VTETSMARSLEDTWREIWPIARPRRSNGATANARQQRRVIGRFAKHEQRRQHELHSSGSLSSSPASCWRTCGWRCDGRSSPTHGGVGATCPSNSRSGAYVTGLVTNWTQS
jgi:hypothetical protein